MLGRVSLKRQVAECLFYYFGNVILAYVFIVYPLLMFEVRPRNVLLGGYYTFVLFWAFLCVWLYFLVPRILVRQCGNCGSKHVFFNFSRKCFCGDCGRTLKLYLSGGEKAKFIILFMAVPFSFSGACFIVGCIFAGITLDYGLMFAGVLLSVLLPLYIVLIAGIDWLFFHKTKYFEGHKLLGFMLSIITLLILMFLTAMGLGMLLKLIFTGSI